MAVLDGVLCPTILSHGKALGSSGERVDFAAPFSQIILGRANTLEHFDIVIIFNRSL